MATIWAEAASKGTTWGIYIEFEQPLEKVVSRQKNFVQDICSGQNSALIQIPNLWGSKQPVPAGNFLPVNISSFEIDTATLAPGGWEGRMLMLFVVKDGEAHSMFDAHVSL